MAVVTTKTQEQIAKKRKKKSCRNSNTWKPQQKRGTAKKKGVAEKEN